MNISFGQKLQIYLGAAGALPWVRSRAVISDTTAGIDIIDVLRSATNGTTPVDVIDGVAGSVSQLKNFNLNNDSGGSVDVYFRLHDGSGDTVFKHFTLASNDQLEWNDADGWQVLGVTGAAGGGILGTANTVAKFTGTGFTVGNSTITDDGTSVIVNTRTKTKASIGGASTTDNFLNVTATLPSGNTQPAYGARFDFTGSGAGTDQVGVVSFLNAGYTGVGNTSAITGVNSSKSTASSLGNGNFGTLGIVNGVTTGTNVGIGADASGGDVNVSVQGSAIGQTGAGNPRTNVGGAFFARRHTSAPLVGVAGLLGNTYPTWEDAAGLFDNGTFTAPVIVARDNGAALPTTGATATVTVQDGATLQYGLGVLTSGTLTVEQQSIEAGGLIHSFLWTNAMVVALGANLTGDITVCTLPAKTVIKNAYVIITGAGAGPTTLTVAFGRTGAAYIDYIVASDAKAAANTVYGAVAGERGTNLTGYDLPSYTGTTAVKLHFISTVLNLDQVTGSTGRVVIETSLIP